LTVVAALALSLVFTAPLDAGAAPVHAPRHMPRLIGLSRAQVFATMKSAQLYFATRGPGSATGTWTVPVAQKPAPGTMVAWHSQARLIVAKTSAHAPRRVPRLIGLSRARTFAAMKRAQLYFRTRGPGSSTGKWIVVLHQSPAPKTLVAWHSVVTLTVSTKRPKPRPTVRRTTTTTVRRTTTTTLKKATATSTSTTTTVPVTTTTYPGETTTTTVTPPTTTSTSTTTTTVRVTTTTVRKRPGRYRIGVATWYSYVPGHCATWYLPFGTRIRVLDLKTGHSVTCIVSDREAAHGNRVVDLSETEFAKLAPLRVGVIAVKVSW
jgi:rare lipoprotein A (peptidoglycan hydrolase)